LYMVEFLLKFIGYKGGEKLLRNFVFIF